MAGEEADWWKAAAEKAKEQQSSSPIPEPEVNLEDDDVQPIKTVIPEEHEAETQPASSVTVDLEEESDDDNLLGGTTVARFQNKELDRAAVEANLKVTDRDARRMRPADDPQNIDQALGRRTPSSATLEPYKAPSETPEDIKDEAERAFGKDFTETPTQPISPSTEE